MTARTTTDPDPESVDRETEAMRLVAAALAPLAGDERRRVLQWAQRFTDQATRSGP